jgi:hypothetical protein
MLMPAAAHRNDLARDRLCPGRAMLSGGSKRSEAWSAGRALVHPARARPCPSDKDCPNHLSCPHSQRDVWREHWSTRTNSGRRPWGKPSRSRHRARLWSWAVGLPARSLAYHDLRWRERRVNRAGSAGTFRGLLPPYPSNLGYFVPISLLWLRSLKMQKALHLQGFYWSEREDLNLRPLVSQTSALTGLRHAPMPFP